MAGNAGPAGQRIKRARLREGTGAAQTSAHRPLPEPAAAPLPATLTPTATPLPAAAPLDGEIHEGYGGPADPDDENPFLMKRKPKRPFNS